MDKVPCPVCAEEYSSSYLKQHIYRVHTVIDAPFPCAVCDSTFKLKDDLKLHQRIHTGEKPYTCTECDMAFTQAHSLSSHMRTHTGEKPYKCSLCDSSFTLMSNLVTHERTHSGERPYKCDDCESSFTQHSALTIHRRRVHTKEFPYKCEHCEKAFSCSQDRLNHTRTHTGEKPYKCSECDGVFGDSSTLKKHVRTHTGERPYKCSECDFAAAVSHNLKTHVRRVHSQEAISRKKVEETKIEKLFTEKYPNLFTREYTVKHTCLQIPGKSNSRLDFLFPMYGKYHVIVEVDEYQHDSYSQICETSRMNNVVSSFRLGGVETPLVFIRYNPHAFKVDGRTRRTTMVERHQKLVELLERLKMQEPGRDVQVCYMFYDVNEGVPDALSDPEYYDTVKEWFVEAIV